LPKQFGFQYAATFEPQPNATYVLVLGISSISPSIETNTTLKRVSNSRVGRGFG